MSLIRKQFFVSVIFVTVMAVVMVLGLPGFAGGSALSGTFPAGEDKDYYLGDVNADGRIDVGDAISILRHIVGLNPFDEDLKDEEALQRADVNLDGEVAVGDAISVLRYIVGLSKQFQVSDPATVMTENALIYVLEQSEAATINLARDIILGESLDVIRNITINGNSEEKHFIKGEEVTVFDDVDSFTAENTEIETLTLLGGGVESVNFINSSVTTLNVDAAVKISIDEDSKVSQANLNSPATVTGGNKIDRILINPQLDVDMDDVFGEDKPGSIISGLIIKEEPSDTFAGSAINPVPSVKLVDDSGEPVAVEGVTVKASLSQGELASGKVTVSTSAHGIACFDDLVITTAGSYRLIFEAGILDPVTSEEIAIVPGNPAGFDLGLGVSSLEYTFSNFVDEYENEIDITGLDFDTNASFINLVAEEGQGEDINVALSELPDFELNEQEGIVTITVATEDILGMGQEDAGVFDGLNLNVHTAVDAAMVDAGGEWEVQLSEYITELPVFPAEALNMIFVEMVDEYMPAVETAMADENNLLYMEEVGPGVYKPLNLIAAQEAYGPANGICKALEAVVLEESLDEQRAYLDWVQEVMEGVEGMLNDLGGLYDAALDVVPWEGGEVTPETVSQAKDAIKTFEDNYGELKLKLNEATGNERDNIIQEAKQYVQMALDQSFDISTIDDTYFAIEAPWLDDPGDKVAYFSLEDIIFHPHEEEAPTVVILDWDETEEAYRLKVEGANIGMGNLELFIAAGTEEDKLAGYFGIEHEVHVFGTYYPDGSVTIDPPPPIWAHPDHLQIAIYEEEDVAFEIEFELGLRDANFAESFSANDVELGGVFSGVYADLNVTNVREHEEYEHHHYVTVAGTLNISADDWHNHREKDEGEHLTGLIAILADGLSGEEAEEPLTAEIIIYPEKIYRPSPQFNVELAHGSSVNGYGWPAVTEITVTIENDQGNKVFQDVIITGEEGQFNLWPGEGEFNIQPGYTVTVTGGDHSAEHLVRYIEVTGFDVDNDIISGNADPGMEVDVVVGDEMKEYHKWHRRTVTSEEDGTWEADFSADVSLEEEMWGFAEKTDESGNATSYNWYIYFPDPYFEVIPHEGIIMGWDWPAESEITVTINEKDYTTHSDDWMYFELGDLGIEPGDSITVSATEHGEEIERTHTVKHLTMEVNRETGYVSGTAKADTVVQFMILEPADKDAPPQTILEEEIIVDSDGNWEYEFGGKIEYNHVVLALQPEDGGATVVTNFIELE